MYTIDDTIVAISTPLGHSGIGILRISGPDALDIARRCFVAKHDQDWRSTSAIRSHHVYYGHLVNPATDERVDEVLLTYMRAPNTFTRQDIVEISGHGGLVPLREGLSLCLAQGARMAREGEFTLRAFVNGRIDLVQAEAVLDMIEAKTRASMRVALNQLNGRLSTLVQDVRRRILSILAYLEAMIDFPTDEVPEEDVVTELEKAQQALSTLIADSSRGILYREGVRTAIIGRPNVGKSSLLNALLRTERAIVTPIPGTTRDTLEETLNLEGIPLILVDTAGIRHHTRDLIEQMGIDRSHRSVEQADLVILVVDTSTSSGSADRAVAETCRTKPVIVVENKCDLPAAWDASQLLTSVPHVRLSARTGQGIPQLESALVQMVFSGEVTQADEPVASNPRHREAFERARTHIIEALAAHRAGLPSDLVSIDVLEAVQALGEVTGETASDELLDTIFGRFCIGK